MKNIIIVGAGGFAIEIIDLINAINHIEPTFNIKGLLDDHKTEFVLDGYEILGKTNDVVKFKEYSFIIAIAKPEIRKAIFGQIVELQLNMPNLIHPKAEISKDAIVDNDSGVIVNYNTQISGLAIIKEGVIVDTSSYIGHESIIESFVTIYPGVFVSGNSKISSQTEIGLGSKVIQGLKIGSNSIIGAGSVVVKDIPSNVIAYGNPCKPMKEK